MLVEKKKVSLKELFFILYGFLPSFVKVCCYRNRGFRIGQNVSIGLGSIKL